MYLTYCMVQLVRMPPPEKVPSPFPLPSSAIRASVPFVRLSQPHLVCGSPPAEALSFCILRLRNLPFHVNLTWSRCESEGRQKRGEKLSAVSAPRCGFTWILVASTLQESRSPAPLAPTPGRLPRPTPDFRLATFADGS